MGFGVQLILFATDLSRYKPALALALVFVIPAGLGRLISLFKQDLNHQSRSTVYSILAVELVLTPVLLGWLLLIDL